MPMQLHNMLKFKMAWAQPSGPHHEIVLSSRIRLARNLSAHPFTSSAAPRMLASICSQVFEAARHTRALAKAAYVHLEDLSALERPFLVERHLISHHLADHPKHRGIIIGDREILSVMVNEEDHLRVQAIDSGLRLSELGSKISALESDLSKRLPFACRKDWGYLTACPTNAGTAMRASALLHLPALSLTGQIKHILEGLSRHQMLARGLYGEETRVLGDFYQISNAASMGRTEEEWIEKISREVLNIVSKEKEAQSVLAHGAKRMPLEDLIFRSIEILTNARSISFEETMQHLSYARMALSMGWKVRFDFEAINELLVLIQPAHIQMLAGKELAAPERDFLRATWLRRKFP